MDQNTATIISSTISAVGAIIAAYITSRGKFQGGSIIKKKNNMKNMYLRPKTIISALIVAIILYVGSQYLIGQTNKIEKSSKPFMVYSDIGIPQGDILVWSGADWGKAAPILINRSYKSNDIPEGKKCFAVIGGLGDDNYVGWGVFLGKFENHKCIKPGTIDLSIFSSLKFYVKTDINLKVEIQQDNSEGKKSFPCLISEYGWNTISRDNFVEVSIPLSAFINVDLRKVFCPFMITGIGNKATFFIDKVSWVP